MDTLKTVGTSFEYLEVGAAVITETDTRSLIDDPSTEPKDITGLTGENKKLRGYVDWGEDNQAPIKLVENIGKSPILSINMHFNVGAGFGQGIQPVKYDLVNNKKVIIPVLDNDEINAFFEDNDINGYFLEQLTDLEHFNMPIPEIITNRQVPSLRKIVELHHKEASFSRWESMNPETGLIDHHYYSTKWDKPNELDKTNVAVTDVLNPYNTVLDLKRRMGLEKRPGKRSLKERKYDDKVYRYIVPIRIPTPGRIYYPKKPYYSLFESGWFDFALMIPAFKKAIMKNQAHIKYMVYINKGYFDRIFSEEGTKEDKKKARIAEEYKKINDYLAGAEKAGKAVIGRIDYKPSGSNSTIIEKDVIIEVIDNKNVGGEYTGDHGEVSKIMSYVTGVHPGMIGANPGNDKNISGTESRELFLIKQLVMKPYINRLLKPLYLTKNINRWDKDIHFIVPNIELTTLDKDKTGTKDPLAEEK